MYRLHTATDRLKKPYPNTNELTICFDTCKYPNHYTKKHNKLISHLLQNKFDPRLLNCPICDMSLDILVPITSCIHHVLYMFVVMFLCLTQPTSEKAEYVLRLYNTIITKDIMATSPDINIIKSDS